jgi:membrane protease YdiL (CAAX protease family)
MDSELLTPPQVGIHNAELGWGWRHVGWALLAFVDGVGLVVLLARFAAAQLGLRPDDTRLVAPLIYVATVGVYLALLLGIYLFGARRAGWAALGLRRTSWWNIALVPLIFLLGFGGLLAVNLLIRQVTGSFENPQVNALTGGKALSGRELLAGLLLIAGLVPFVEELFFRGMIYPLLRQRAPVVVAIMANAGLFAVAHVAPIIIPGLFVVGLCLAFLRERSGSIWPSVLFHAIQNGLALLAINAALASGAL